MSPPESTTPDSVEQLLKLWREHDIKAWSPEAIREAKQRIRDAIFGPKRDDEEPR